MLRNTSSGEGRGDTLKGGFSWRDWSRWEGILRLILDTVDRVWGALRPAVPSQDVFEVAGLEFHVLKKIRGVLSNVSCRKWDQGKQMSLWAPNPSRLTNCPKRGSEDQRPLARGRAHSPSLFTFP